MPVSEQPAVYRTLANLGRLIPGSYIRLDNTYNRKRIWSTEEYCVLSVCRACTSGGTVSTTIAIEDTLTRHKYELAYTEGESTLHCYGVDYYVKLKGRDTTCPYNR